MRQLVYRLSITWLGLAVFWLLGMLSSNEFAKTSVLLITSMFGIVGVITILLKKKRVAWISILSISLILLFFFDAAIKGFLRNYFGLRPNPIVVLEVLFNTTGSETQEFFLHNWLSISYSVLTFIIISFCAIYAERYLSRRQNSSSLIRPAYGTKIFTSAMLIVFIALHFNPTMAKENPVLFWPLRYVQYQENLQQIAAIQASINSNMAARSEWLVDYIGEPKRTVVLVIGESTNRANMSVYGYDRKTTPSLNSLRNDLLVFQDVVSSEPVTIASMIKMLTPANLAQPND